MSNRNEEIKKWRPTIKSINTELDSCDTELFQNEVLRPILKFQNDLLLTLFSDNRKKYKVDFKNLSTEERLSYTDKSIKQDSKFRALLIGAIVGLFSLEEYHTYSKESSVMNRRIVTMLVQRFQDQLELLQ